MNLAIRKKGKYWEFETETHYLLTDKGKRIGFVVRSTTMPITQPDYISRRQQGRLLIEMQPEKERKPITAADLPQWIHSPKANMVEAKWGDRRVGNIGVLTFHMKPLRVFLCHSSTDKPAARGLYKCLKADGFEPWLDEEDLLAGQDWQQEIAKAIVATDIVIVCLSQRSISKTGFVQKEIKFALDRADEQPEGTIFIIPLKLEECTIPHRLSRWHWINYFEEKGYELLLRALKHRANTIVPTPTT